MPAISKEQESKWKLIERGLREAFYTCVANTGQSHEFNAGPGTREQVELSAHLLRQALIEAGIKEEHITLNLVPYPKDSENTGHPTSQFTLQEPVLDLSSYEPEALNGIANSLYDFAATARAKNRLPWLKRVEEGRAEVSAAPSR